MLKLATCWSGQLAKGGKMPELARLWSRQDSRAGSMMDLATCWSWQHAGAVWLPAGVGYMLKQGAC